MNIVNSIVYNVKGQKGVIKEIAGNKIKIHYKQSDGTIKESIYQYPNAFRQGFLKFRDENLNDYIMQVIDLYKCDYCENKDMQTEEIDGKRVALECKKIKVDKCYLCEEDHLKENFIHLDNEKNIYWKRKKIIFSTKQLCPICAQENTFRCNRCGKRLYNEKLYKNLKDKSLCKECADEVVKQCYFCKELFDKNDGETFYRDAGTKYVCPKCIEKHTFKCSKCKCLELYDYLAESKYISKDKKLCLDCVDRCENCNEYIEVKKTVLICGKKYCPDCWNLKKIKCNICQGEYIPKNKEKICPDCIEMKQYIKRLEKINFEAQKFITMSLYNLENVNRCKLFTELYDSCIDLEYSYREPRNKDPFHLLIISVMNYDVVITYLPSEIIGNVKYSKDITLTEFRRRKVYSSVVGKIKYWVKIIEKYTVTSAGKMKVLGYPIRLRIQTKYDKIYGKEWNGRGYYTEIGNYGDTTDFYIIGIIEKKSGSM